MCKFYFDVSKFSNKKFFKTSPVSSHGSFSYSLTPWKRRLSLRDWSSRSHSLSFSLLLSPLFLGLSLPILYSVFLIFSSIISCHASILSCTSLTWFTNLIYSLLLLVISDDNLSILWLVTNATEFTFSIRTFFIDETFLENRSDGITGYDLIWIISHLSYVFGFCSIFASCRKNELKQDKSETN